MKNVELQINVYDGLKNCSGRFIKLISPGDALADKLALAKWTDHLVESGRGWSICDVINYKMDNGKIETLSRPANPQQMKAYLKNDIKAIRWNYVVLNDLATGAATLCTKELLYEYLEHIIGRVIYAEDNCYRLMNFQGEVAYYYPDALILYEYGDGVSTSGKKEWSGKLLNDWCETDKIMTELLCKNDKYQAKLLASIVGKSRNQKQYVRLLKLILRRRGFRTVFRRNIAPRMTKTELRK